MKVLFISKSSKGKPSLIVQNQANRLIADGVNIEFFLIEKRGVLGYIQGYFKLKKFLSKRKFDIYHAHYGLTAIVATLTGVKPLVVSLMGSDVEEGGWQLFMIKLFSKSRWSFTITKSQRLANIVGKEYCCVIPNGVDLKKFVPIEIKEARRKLNLPFDKTLILFAADPKREEKNYSLFKKSYENIESQNTTVLCLGDIAFDEIVYWMNAADVVVLSSLWEGSPNVIKEGMACNKPMVSTKVGDVPYLFENTSGLFLADFNVEDYSKNLKLALDFAKENKKAGGRNQVKRLGLSSEEISKKIIENYEKLILE